MPARTRLDPRRSEESSPIIRLTGQLSYIYSYTPISDSQISRKYSRFRFYRSSRIYPCLRSSHYVQACTGVDFTFAELVGNSCLTYSYCPAMPLALSFLTYSICIYALRSLLSTSGGFTASRALSGTIFRASHLMRIL